MAMPSCVLPGVAASAGQPPYHRFPDVETVRTSQPSPTLLPCPRWPRRAEESRRLERYMETPKEKPRFTIEQLDAELAKVTDQAYSARFAAELAKFEEEQRRREVDGRRLGNE